MQFYKLLTNRNIVTNQVEIHGDSLKISITDQNDDLQSKPSFVGEFSISQLIADYSQDHGCIALFPSMFADGAPIVALETTQASLPFKTGVNLSQNLPNTLEGKQFAGSPFSIITNTFGSYAFAYILTPFKNCSKDDLIVVVRDSESLDLKAEGATPSTQSIASMKYFLDAWMPITITGPSAMSVDSTQTFTVEAPDNAVVYLSSDIGVLNRSQVRNGGSFILNTDGLLAGESITIKAGYKYWASVSKKTIDLS